MKRIFLLLIVLLNSCSSFIYNEIERIGVEIINEPDRILNLNKYYPEHYSDSIIYNKMKDSSYLLNFNNYLKTEFNVKNSGISIYKVSVDSCYLRMFKKSGYQYNLNPENIYSITICKKNDCIDLMMIKQNNSLYFFIIKKNILSGYPH